MNPITHPEEQISADEVFGQHYFLSHRRTIILLETTHKRTNLNAKYNSILATLVTAIVLLGTNQVPAAPFTILGSGGDFSTAGATGSTVAVDPVNSWFYASGGISFNGSGQLLRIDVTNPAVIGAPVTISNTFNAGVAVNPSNGRIGAVDPQGFSSQFRVYNPDLTVFDTESITGCGADIADGNGTFGMSTQCTDRLTIYDETAQAIVHAGSGAVGSSVVYNGATGNYYHNRTPGSTTEINEFSFATAALPAEGGGDVQILEANSVTNRLYGVEAPTGPFVILDGNNAPAGVAGALVSIAGLSIGDLAVSTNLNQLYMHNISTGNIEVRDGASAGLLDTFNLGGGWTPRAMEMTDGSNLLYVTAQNVSNPGINRLFVLQVIPEPSTFGLGILALAGFGCGAWRRRVPAGTFRFTT